jgi:hypothetical protein
MECYDMYRLDQNSKLEVYPSMTLPTIQRGCKNVIWRQMIYNHIKYNLLTIYNHKVVRFKYIKGNHRVDIE